MLTALLVGLAASSALVVGALVGVFWKPPGELVAAALAFASGALITALAYDLFEEAFKDGGIWLAGGALLAGAAVFIVASSLLDHYTSSGASGFALIAGVTLDGIPENLALGVVLIGSSLTGILALLAAIWASNLPEALGSAENMSNKHSKGFVLGIWVATAVLLTAAVVIGNTIFAGVDKDVLAFVRAFAGGAVLASTADTIMPQAYERGGIFVAFATAAGFLLTFALSH